MILSGIGFIFKKNIIFAKNNKMKKIFRTIGLLAVIFLVGCGENMERRNCKRLLTINKNL